MPQGLLAKTGNQAAGLTRGLLYGGLGAPVDLTNMLLLGAGGKKPVGGSAWLESKVDPLLSRVIGPQNEGQKYARFAGDVVAPGPGELASGMKAVQGLLADPAMQQKIIGGLLGMTAYHGSPHKFDKFELSDKTIGTGEGAQAYGHGLYFAEDPGVAGKYYDKFAFPGGRTQTDSRLDSLVAEYGGDVDKAVDRFMQSVYESPKVKQKMRAELVESLRQRPQAHLYHVDIPDESIANMLDWDAPLSEQPEAVKAGLRQAFEKRGFAEWQIDSQFEKNITGQQAYVYLSGAKGPEVGSSVLREAGIPGIRYLDGGSRNKGDGTRNFVVFDDSILKVLKRE